MLGEILAILGFFGFVLVCLGILMWILWHEPCNSDDSVEDNGFGL